MRSLQAARIAQKNIIHGGEPEIWLVELYRDATNVVRYAIPCEEDITWNSLTWSKKGGIVDPPRMDMATSQVDCTVTISDADHTDVDRLAAGEYIDHRAAIYLVNRGNLSDATDYVRFRGLIVDANVEEALVSFTIGQYGMRYTSIPRTTMDRDRCTNDFKDLRCAYAGVDATCTKTLVACAAKSNKSRYRGFPGMLKMRP